LTTTGNITVGGNLIVNGTTTTINAATLDVVDLNITIAKNAPSAASANGAGITINGASATILYGNTNDNITFNKRVDATSFYGSGVGITNIPNSATTATVANVANTIVARNGAGGFSAGVISATATSAQYADLAEMYQSDGQYDPGTVLVFGGRKEVTTTGHQADVSVAGVVSTAPAYLMNVDAVDAVAVALRGKVPVKIMGPVRKGDLLVTSYISGYAMSVGRDASYGVAIFAKSLDEDLTEGQKLINAVII
jgi:hypothetical protein